MERDLIAGMPSCKGNVACDRLVPYHSYFSRLGILPAVLLCFALITSAFAQYRTTHWDTDAGLPQNIVRGIVQTPDGYLWVATLNGVARFDGVHFTTFDKSNSPGISTNRFAAIVQGSGGDLWLMAENGALMRYHQGDFQSLSGSQGVAALSVHGITTDKDGQVWILSDGKILKWENAANQFTPSGTSDGATYKPLRWVGTGFWTIEGRTLECFVHGTSMRYELPAGLSVEEILNVAVGADGAVWLALSNDRLAQLSGNKWTYASNSIETRFVSPGRSNWKAVITSRLERFLKLPSESPADSIFYNAIFEDSEHNVWVGAEGQGLYRIEQPTIHTYSHKDGLAGDNVYPVLAASNGDIWIGTWPAGVTHFRQGAFQTYSARQGVPGLVTALAESDSGALWIGTHTGLALLSSGEIKLQAGLPNGFPVIQAIYQQDRDSLLLGTPEGVYRYPIAGGQGTWLHTKSGASLGDVRVIVRGRQGELWFGGYGGLTRLYNGTFTHWTEQSGLPSSSVRAIYEDQQGVLWVGTYDGGLGRLAGGRWTRYNKANGLFDNGVFQILEDSHGNLWMSSNHGIFRVRKAQLNGVADGSASAIISVSYGRSDGMLNTECNGGMWPAGAVDKQGKLWFPTQDGVAVVDPDAVPVTHQRPRAVIESASIDHAPSDIKNALVMASGQESLEIEYTALSFYRPDQAVFRYKMEGLDTAWQSVGYRRIAYFSHMPAGHYNFRLMAANSDGIWSEVASLPVTVLPPFYLSTWFIALAVLVSGLLLYALWSYRIRQLRRMQAAQHAFSQQLIYSQESERRRISAELHDGLGQKLILIKNYALLLQRSGAEELNPEEQRQTFKDIDEEAARAIEETRAISYNLRPIPLDRLGLTKALEALVNSAARATQIRLITHFDDIDNSFAEDLRINFYRIVQEGLNNIIKHSGATEAEIVVRENSTHITLSIRDNGKGFAQEVRSVQQIGKGGFGLTGMQERAAVLGGVLKVQSVPGSGTTLLCEFDLTARTPAL